MSPASPRQQTTPPASVRSVRYRIEHLTAYDYSQEVAVSHHLGRLCPLGTSGQTLLDFRLEVSPAPAIIGHDHDYYGNRVERFSIQEAHARLRVLARADVVVSRSAPDLGGDGRSWEEVRDSIRADRGAAGLAAYECSFRSAIVPVGEVYADYIRPSFPKGRPLLEAVMDLTRRIHTDFTFDPAATTVATPVSEVLARRRGVCQDFAHLQIACLRSLGLPARYVSGYVRTEPPPGKPRLVGVDATHAWVAVFSPGIGWVEFDPTNRCLALNNHVRVAYGRDFEDVSPLRGTVVGGGWQRLTIGVTMTPSDEEEAPHSQSQNQTL